MFQLIERPLKQLCQKCHPLAVQKNLRTIFLPLGISHVDLDAQVVSACNQLAQKRGQFAHVSFKIHQQVDPMTERDNIRHSILPELNKLEKQLKVLL